LGVGDGNRLGDVFRGETAGQPKGECGEPGAEIPGEMQIDSFPGSSECARNMGIEQNVTGRERIGPGECFVGRGPECFNERLSEFGDALTERCVLVAMELQGIDVGKAGDPFCFRQGRIDE
jgi:hypothetical protein